MAYIYLSPVSCSLFWLTKEYIQVSKRQNTPKLHNNYRLRFKSWSMTYLGTSALNLLNVCCGAINLEGTADVETGPIEEVRILQHHWKWALNRGKNKKIDPPTDQIHFLRQWREHGGPTQVTPLGDTYVYVWYVCLFLHYTFLI